MLRNCWLKWFENRMHYRRLVGRSTTRRGRTAASNRPVPVRIGEVLEDRTLLTTFVVDTTVDESDGDFSAGDLSLREALEQAEASAGADIIRFAPNVNGAVFNITMGALPTINQDLQILGTIGNAQTINGAGLVVNAAGAGTTTTFGMNSVNLNAEPTGAGLQVNATGDGVANVTVFNSRITNAATQGVKFVAHTGGVVNLTMSVVFVVSNGDVTPSEGILGEVGTDVLGAESLTTPGNFATANLNFSTLRVSGQKLEGLKISVADGGKVTTTNDIRGSAFSDNGIGNQRSGVKLTATGAGSSLSANFDASSANRATGHGFEFRGDAGATLNIGVKNGTAVGVAADAMNVTLNGASGTFNVDGFTGTGAGDNGVELMMSNAATASFNSLNNALLSNSGRSGLKVGVVSGSLLNAFNASGVTSNGTGGSGAELTTLNATSNFSISGLTANGNAIRGVQVGLNDGATSTKTFTNLTATGNLIAQPMSIGARNSSILNLTVNGGRMSSSGAASPINNVIAIVGSSSTANMTFDGIDMDGSTSSGIVANYDNANGTLNVRNTTSRNNQAVGIAVFARNGADVDGNFNNVDVSNAGQGSAANGIRLDILGAGATGDFTFDGVTADGASGHGISLFYNGGASGSVAKFDNVNARNAGRDGVNVNVRGAGTQLTSFVANNVNANGAGGGTSQTGDGFDVMVAGPGAMANFTFTNLNVDGAGGRGAKIQVENTASLGLNVDGFSADNNGLEGIALDVGTIVGGAQMMGAVFANGTASSNGRAFMINRSGIRTTVRGAGTNAGLTFDTVSANSNTADGFELSGATGATMTVDLKDGSAGLGNSANGVDFTGDGAATTVALSSTMPGNAFDGNGGDGVNVRLTNGVTANDVTVQGSASMNQGDGIDVSDDGTGVTINNLQVTGSAQVNGNLGNGLIIVLDGTMGINSLDLSSLTVNNNVGDQIHVSLKDMTLTDISLNNLMAVGPGAGTGMGDGVELTLDNTSVTNSLSLNGVIATNNGEDGLQLNFRNGAMIPATSAIDLGTFDNNGQHGVNIGVTNSTIDLSVTNSTAATTGSISSLSGNGGNGLNVELNAATLRMGSVDNLTINGNTGAGVHIQAATPSTFISNNSFTNNTITNNGSFGFRSIFNGGTFDIAIGAVGAGNLFDTNTGAAISVDMVQNTTGRLVIDSNTIINTADGGAVFNGEGIFVRQLGTVNPAQATNSLTAAMGPGLLIRNNRIGVNGTGGAAGNASYGVTFQSEEQSNISGLHVFDNQISNNGDDGLSFRRFDEVTVTDFRIEANTFNANSGDGIEITGENDTTSLMDVIIGPDAPTAAQLMTDSITTPLPAAAPRGNTITNNTGDGIRLQVNADARLNVNVRNNFIVNNNDDGIGLNEVVLDASDGRQISGVWVQNTIADNGDRGVEISAVTFGTVRGGDGLTVFDMRDGVSPAQGIYARGNTIGAVLDSFGQVVPGQDGNGSTGIEINGGGASTWINTQILRNGRERIGNRAVGHGVDIQAVSKDVILDNNLIRENFQDGVELNASGVSFINLDMFRNRTQLNEGRGLDILTQQLADSRVQVRNGAGLFFSNGPATAARNFFNSNVEEGVYHVTTASPSQGQSDFAAVALAQNGSVTNSFSTASLIIDNATISNNGNTNVGNLVASAGLVVRVGTQDAPSVFSTSHFATLGDGTPSFINGGAFLQLTNSTLQGNFGDDVFIHGFRSTGDPGTIGGTWSDTQFAPTNTSQGDPLARLDVVFGSANTGNANVFDSVDLNNSLRRGTPDGQAGAFYDNAEGTFKSRTSNLNPGGPFSNNSADRRRNAQRAPERTYSGGFMLAPTVSPDGGIFQFPGMGDSTFRVMVSGDTTTASQLSSTGFFFDDFPTGGDFSPIESPFDANGVGFTGSQGSFELPFGWGTF